MQPKGGTYTVLMGEVLQWVGVGPVAAGPLQRRTVAARMAVAAYCRANWWLASSLVPEAATTGCSDWECERTTSTKFSLALTHVTSLTP